jgi:hypothetical protein
MVTRNVLKINSLLYGLLILAMQGAWAQSPAESSETQGRNADPLLALRLVRNNKPKPQNNAGRAELPEGQGFGSGHGNRKQKKGVLVLSTEEPCSVRINLDNAGVLNRPGQFYAVDLDGGIYMLRCTRLKDQKEIVLHFELYPGKRAEVKIRFPE